MNAKIRSTRRLIIERRVSIRAEATEFAWSKHSKYALVTDNKGEACIEGRGRTTDRYRYFPMAYPQLPFYLEKVGWEDESSALEFVENWGLLGRSKLLAPMSSGSSSDPLWFIWWSARSVRNVIDLYEALESEDSKRIESVVNRVLVPESVLKEGRFDATGHSITRGNYESLVYPDYDSVEDIALATISQIVFRNISTLRAVVTFEPYGEDIERPVRPVERFKRGYQMSSLAEAIWSQLAAFLASSDNVGTCENCQSRFWKMHGNRYYCPNPDPYDPVGGEDSKCAIQSRNKRRPR